MTYNEALDLNRGDIVIVKDTGEEHIVEGIRGKSKTISVILDNGESYRHEMLERI